MRGRPAAVLLLLTLLVATAGAQTVDFTAGQGVELDPGSGTAVTLGHDTGMSYSNPFPDSSSVSVQQTTVTGPDGSAVTLHDPSSSSPTLSSISTSGGVVEAKTDGIQRVGVEASITELVYKDADLTSDATEFQVSGTGTLYVHGFSSGQWVYAQRTGGTDTLEQADSSGVVSVGVGGGADITLLETDGPSLSNPSPDGGVVITQRDVSLEADLEDPDFSADEEVTLEWHMDGSLRGTTTETANGTASLDLTGIEGGTHEWHVVATDREGNTAQLGSASDPQTFQVPDELYIRDEQEPSQLINDANATIEFYYENDNGIAQIETRDASDGVVDMTGLPADAHFVVVADAEGHYARRIYVPSLIETQNVYLINESADVVQPVLVLTDFTGRYQTEDTVLEIQRNINGSWQTVVGDYFGGANEVGAQLEFNTRHRLIITNVRTGRSRTLGSYTPTSSNIVDLEVHADNTFIKEEGRPVISFEPSVRAVPGNTTVDMAAAISPDDDSDLGSYEVEVTTENGTILHSYSGDNPSGEEHEFQVDTTGLAGQDITVSLNWSLSDSEVSGSHSVTFVVRENFGNENALIPALLSIGEGAGASGGPSPATALITLFASMIAMGFTAARGGTGTAGLVGLGVLAAGSLIGFFAWTWFVACALAWAILSGLKQRV